MIISKRYARFYNVIPQTKANIYYIKQDFASLHRIRLTLRHSVQRKITRGVKGTTVRQFLGGGHCGFFSFLYLFLISAVTRLTASTQTADVHNPAKRNTHGVFPGGDISQ